MVSALHNFGKAVVRATNGKRIPIQATAAGTRREVSRGKAKIPAVKWLERTSNPMVRSYFLPTGKEPKGKRQHNLLQSRKKVVANLL